MTLTRRLVLMVAGCIALAVLMISLVFGWLGRQALIAQAENQAHGVARIVAESARLTEVSLEEMQDVLLDDLATLALAVAHLSEPSPADLSDQLAEIAARSNLDSIWLIDAEGNVLANSVGNYGAVIRGESLPATLSREALDALTSGRKFSVDFGAPVDGTRYVGVRVPGNRALIAGQPVAVLDAVRAANSLPVLLEALLDRDDILAIQVLDDTFRLLARVGEAVPPGTVADMAAAAVSNSQAASTLRDGRLWVSAPIRDTAGITIGATVLEMSNRRLDLMLLDYLLYGAAAAALVFAVGVSVAAVFASRIARPVVAMTRAAGEIDRRVFQPQSIDRLAAAPDELGTLARVFQHMAIEVQTREQNLEAQVRARTLELEQKNALLEESKRRVETELDAARSLQAAILPQALPVHPSYTGKATMVPARELGGDFYDFFALDQRHLGIVIADVSGKGVPAAFFMAISRTVLQSSAREHRAPGACLARANTLLCDQNPMDLFVTTFYGILDTQTGDLAYANGGHNPPMMIRRGDGSVTDLPRTGGMALGVMPGMAYTERTTRLEAGDTLFLYTDGISEAMDAGGQEFTEARLRTALGTAHAQAVDVVIESVTRAVDRFVGQAEQSDDITCLVIRYLGPRPAVAAVS
ncbi:HAMP domain-containing protein [Oleomonas cavernae]|uniref:HAMP domain-containing protein n=1 Tax=Oleomonas cavernae TaxID=2320859 RepID=A0A418VUF8_9PROT|nr:PP2C family protein-serine/threonine phosphatase [Oleomonas cavernae]RJF80786.1 HAMP domain-containing protein [Oleomonas cavernae]